MLANYLFFIINFHKSLSNSLKGYLLYSQWSKTGQRLTGGLITLCLLHICLSIDGEPVHSTSKEPIWILTPHYSPITRNLILSPSGKRPVFLYNIAWSQYKGGNGKIWLVNDIINLNAILQQDLFCYSHRK